MTPSTILQVDLSILDKEIADLEKRLQLRKELREFARAYSLSTVNEDSAKNPIIPNSSEIDSREMGITEFILRSLQRGGKKPSGEIAKEYANYKGVDVDDVRGNMYNTVHRLIKSDRLKGENVAGVRSIVVSLPK